MWLWGKIRFEARCHFIVGLNRWEFGGTVRMIRVHIETFRGIRLADLHFDGTTVLLGNNNTGKAVGKRRALRQPPGHPGKDGLKREQMIDAYVTAMDANLPCQRYALATESSLVDRTS